MAISITQLPLSPNSQVPPLSPARKSRTQSTPPPLFLPPNDHTRYEVKYQGAPFTDSRYVLLRILQPPSEPNNIERNNDTEHLFSGAISQPCSFRAWLYFLSCGGKKKPGIYQSHGPEPSSSLRTKTPNDGSNTPSDTVRFVVTPRPSERTCWNPVSFFCVLPDREV